MVAINYARDVRIGDKPARAVALGSNFVWPALPDRLFLRGQSLVYDFVGQKYAARLPDDIIDYTTNVNDLGILTRASTATYWGPSGTLLEAAVDEARIQHDPVTGEPLGVLAESSATNLIPQSTSLDDRGYWSAGVDKSTVSSIQDEHVPNAFLISGIEGGSSDFLFGRNSGFTTEPRTVSVLIRRGSHRYVRVGNRSFYNRTMVTVDIETGNVIGQNDIIGVEVNPVGDWVEVKFKTNSPGNVAGFYLSLTDEFGDFFTLAGGESLVVALPGIYEGLEYSSYIPTIDSPVTRAADEVSIDLSDVFNPEEGTLRITAQVPEGEVVASLGGIDILSDSDELKEYTLTHGDSVSGSELTLGYGIFQSLEYFPEAQP